MATDEGDLNCQRIGEGFSSDRLSPWVDHNAFVHPPKLYLNVCVCVYHFVPTYVHPSLINALTVCVCVCALKLEEHQKCNRKCGMTCLPVQFPFSFSFFFLSLLCVSAGAVQAIWYGAADNPFQQLLRNNRKRTGLSSGREQESIPTEPH